MIEENQDNFKKSLIVLEELNNNELEEKRNEYSQKMLEDAARYQELMTQKDEEQRNFF